MQLRTLAPPIPAPLRDVARALGKLFMLDDVKWRDSRMLIANNYKNAAYARDVMAALGMFCLELKL